MQDALKKLDELQREAYQRGYRQALEDAENECGAFFGLSTEAELIAEAIRALIPEDKP